MNRFDEKVIIITNANSTIGAATAGRFLAEGASVVLSGDTESLRETASGLDWRRILFHEGNLSEEAYAERLVEDTVSQFGRVDVLVNNVQSAKSRPLPNNTTEQWGKVTEQWHKMMPNDLDGVFFAVRSALPHLLQTRGAIVNVSLASENGGDRGASVYNTARGAVKKLTRTVAIEVASQGVRVNAVSPRLTSTAIANDFENTDSFLIQSMERIPVGRGAAAEEVAGVIVFLASEDATFVNGVDLPVDGGFTTAD